MLNRSRVTIVLLIQDRSYSASLPWLCRCTPWCCIDSCPLPLNGISPPEYDESATFLVINVNSCTYSYFEICFKTVELSDCTVSIKADFVASLCTFLCTFYRPPWFFYKPPGPAACARCQDSWATKWCYIFCKRKIFSRLKSLTTVGPVHIAVTAGICITKAMNRPLAALWGRPPGLG